MNETTRDRKIEKAKGILRASLAAFDADHRAALLRTCVLFVHKSSNEMFHAVKKDAANVDGGFVLGFTAANQPRAAAFSEVPLDQIACLVSVDGRHVRFGLSLSDLEGAS